MALIRSLPEESSTFASSILLLDKLDKATIHQAFVTEETQCRRRAADISGIGTAFSSSSTSSSKVTDLCCTFCGMKNHLVEKCYLFGNAQKAAKDAVKERSQNRRKKNKANKASKSSEKEESKETAEFAGNASVLSTYDPS